MDQLYNEANNFSDPEKIEQELSIARKHLQLSESDKLPIGVGFLTWKLDKNGPDALDTALKAGVKAVWFSFGSDIGKWVKYVRSHSAGQDVLIFVVISTVEEARVATFEWKADVIVAQGQPKQFCKFVTEGLSGHRK